MKFALIVHPQSLKQRLPRGLARPPGRAAPLQHVSKLLRGLAQAMLDSSTSQGIEVVESRLMIRSADGSVAEARVLEVPFGTADFLLEPAAALESIRQAIDVAGPGLMKTNVFFHPSFVAPSAKASLRFPNSVVPK